MQALARDVEDCLATEYQCDDRQGPQGRAVESEGEAPDGKADDAEVEIAAPQDDASDGQATYDGSS